MIPIHKKMVLEPASIEYGFFTEYVNIKVLTKIKRILSKIKKKLKHDNRYTYIIN